MFRCKHNLMTFDNYMYQIQQRESTIGNLIAFLLKSIFSVYNGVACIKEHLNEMIKNFFQLNQMS